MRKRSICFALVVLMVFAILPVTMVRADTNISVIIDGRQVNFEGQSPIIADGATYVEEL